MELPHVEIATDENHRQRLRSPFDAVDIAVWRQGIIFSSKHMLRDSWKEDLTVDRRRAHLEALALGGLPLSVNLRHVQASEHPTLAQIHGDQLSHLAI